MKINEFVFTDNIVEAEAMTDTWPHAKDIAKGIVSDWMHLEADERKMDVLVKAIEVELIKAFGNGITAAVPITKSTALEEAAKVAEGFLWKGDPNWIADAIRGLKGQPIKEEKNE